MHPVHVSLFTGVSYLQGMVVYSWLVIDLPARHGRSEKALQNAYEYYEKRKATIPYKIVPLFCIALTAGVIGNVWLCRADLVSLGMLAITFGTAANNGKNVVDPVNSLDKLKPKETAAALTGIGKGHLVDIIGFTAIVMLNFLSLG